MTESFHEAMTAASGQAVLGAARIGGWAYDDFDTKNGVFTGAIVQGLRGAADRDDRGLITVETLADYVDKVVEQWVEKNKPATPLASRGITKQLDGPAEKMPLAVDPTIFGGPQGYLAGREAAARRLANFEESMDAAILVEIRQALEPDDPSAARELLIDKILAVGWSADDIRRLTDFFRLNRAELLGLAANEGEDQH